MQKIKKWLTLFAGASLFVIGLFIARPVQAESWNVLAEKNSYVGTTFLYRWLATQNIRYHKFYQENKIKYRHGKPEGVVIHETNDPGATAAQEALYFNRDWNKMYAYVHAFVDHKMVIQMMTPDYGVWGAGPMANDRFVQVELCEESTRANFARSINNDAIYAAHILHRYALKPVNAIHDGKGTVWSHLAVSKFLGGTNHGDPDGYFAKWGYSMDDFFRLIVHYYDLQESKPIKQENKEQAGKSQEQTKADPNGHITQAPKVKLGANLLKHDAYVYSLKGKRGKTVMRAGTVVNLRKKVTVKGRDFYQIGKNALIVAANIVGRLRKLTRNAYLYDTAGLSTGSSRLLKGAYVRTYGGMVKIMGVSYYSIGVNRFIKAEALQK